MANWQNLSSRERLLVGVVLPLVSLVLAYLYLWQPLRDDVSRMRLSVPEKTASLAWMRYRLANTDVADVASGRVANDGPLLTVIERVAIDAGIKNAIQRVQPGNDGSVELWFQEVVADQLFRWIDQLSGSGIAVYTATVTRASPGLVSARIKLRRPAP
jgi:type II secretory pathway component PulM